VLARQRAERLGGGALDIIVQHADRKPLLLKQRRRLGQVKWRPGPLKLTLLLFLDPGPIWIDE